MSRYDYLQTLLRIMTKEEVKQLHNLFPENATQYSSPEDVETAISILEKIRYPNEPIRENK